MAQSLSRIMLIHIRDFVIKHKGIFEKAIIAYAKALPEPTKEMGRDGYCLEPTSHVLLDFREKFRSYYANPTKQALFEAGWKIAIDENEHDPHYRDIVFGWLVEELVEAVLDGRWPPRRSGHPSSSWKEPQHGKYRGRKFARFIGQT